MDGEEIEESIILYWCTHVVRMIQIRYKYMRADIFDEIFGCINDFQKLRVLTFS